MTKQALRVKIADRDPEVEHLRMILGMMGFRFEYENVDLINRSLKAYKEKGGDFSLDDTFDIRESWEQDWNAYYRPKLDIKLEGDE